MSEKLDMQSPNWANLNSQFIAERFPNCVTESADGIKIDFDLLKQELSNDLIEGTKERYRLEWPGKKEAIVTANLPTTKTLRPIREDSVDFDNTENIYIEGDNLEVLKLLQESYLGKIKMIYIDPPYNTGKDFVYKDNFSKDAQDELLESGQKDKYNQRLVVNTETAGRYHSDWLTMMYPRLKLARNLMKEDGILFISIDNNEVHNLRKICDEIFGEVNSLLGFIWELPRGINAGFISKGHEFILAYSKDINKLNLFFKEESSVSIERCNKKIDSRHPESSIYFPAGIPYDGPDAILTGVIDGSEKIRIEGELNFKNGQLHKPVTLFAGWTMKKMIQDWIDGKEVFDLKGQKIKRFFFKENGKLYSEKEVQFDSPKSILKNLGDSQTARKELFKYFNSEDIFDYPKPTTLINRLAKYVLNENDIILDFFSGSGVTGDSLLQLNSQDLVNRKYILVQLPELTDISSNAYKAGYNNICEIGKDRIRKAALKIKEETDATIDYGFRVFRLDESNMQDVYYKPQDYKQARIELFADNVKTDRTGVDLLAQVMLDWGLPLSLKIEQVEISGKQVYKVAENSLYACFDKNIDEQFAKELAASKPLRVVFRDSGFKDDTAKTNVKQLLKQLSPETEMKVI